jgi:hypothetical protein
MLNRSIRTLKELRKRNRNLMRKKVSTQSIKMGLLIYI